MKLTFKQYLQLHSRSAFDFYTNDQVKNNTKTSTYRVMKSRLADYKVRYEAIQNLDDSKQNEKKGWQFLLAAESVFEHKEYQNAIKLLTKCEKYALNRSNYNLLNEVYGLKIKYADQIKDLNIKQLFKSIQVNNKRLLQRQKINLAYLNIKQDYKGHLHNMQKLDLSDLIKRTLSLYEIEKDLSVDPVLLYQLVEITDLYGAYTYDYSSVNLFFESEIEKQLEKETNVNNYHLQESLYLMANIYFRTGDFSKSKYYLKRLSKLLKKHNNLESELNAKHLFLKCLNEIYTNGLAKATEALKEAKSMSHYQSRLYYNLELTEVLLYFIKEKYRNAVSIINKLYKSDRWYLSHVGRDWIIYKQIMEVLLHIELENNDLAESRFNSLMRKHKQFFKDFSQFNVIPFLHLVKRCINMDKINVPEFEAYAEEKLAFKTNQYDDVLLKSFYAWLKSKVYKVSLYDSILDLVKH